MPSFCLHPKFGGYSVKFNPWDQSTLAVAAAENFGISGCGALYFLRMESLGPGPSSRLVPEGFVPTPDGCFDVTYCENDPNLVVAACGDGVKIVQRATCQVVQNLMEHSAEVYGVQWNSVSKDSFASASWDQTIKVWPAGAPNSIVTFAEHGKEVYEVNWNPRIPTTLASCSGDGLWKLFDIRQPRSAQTVPGHGGEIILSLDWNKYDPNVLATSSVDRTVRLWDVRRPQQPLCMFRGHEAAVRRVRCSPHSRNLLLSTGYDFRLILWDTDRGRGREGCQRYDHHREFVVGADWSLVEAGLVATCAWDGLVFTWSLGSAPSATHNMQPPLPPFVPPPRTMPPRPRRAMGEAGRTSPPLPMGPPPVVPPRPMI